MKAPALSNSQIGLYGLPGFARAYSEAILGHEWMQGWTQAALAEPWAIDRFER